MAPVSCRDKMPAGLVVDQQLRFRPSATQRAPFGHLLLGRGNPGRFPRVDARSSRFRAANHEIVRTAKGNGSPPLRELFTARAAKERRTLNRKGESICRSL